MRLFATSESSAVGRKLAGDGVRAFPGGAAENALSLVGARSSAPLSALVSGNPGSLLLAVGADSEVAGGAVTSPSSGLLREVSAGFCPVGSSGAVSGRLLEGGGASSAVGVTGVGGVVIAVSAGPAASVSAVDVIGMAAVEALTS